jgi:arylsulfatase A-like enzyme
MSNPKGKNILFLFADQMHAFAMGCMGNPEVKTPHLDQMAAEGILFSNMYSCAPLCTPYRGVLFTGRYPSQTGVKNNQSPLPGTGSLLAQCLNEGGYRTSYVGKWHLGATGNIAVEPELRGGFQEFTGYQCYNEFLRNNWFFDEEGNKTEYFEHRTDVTTDIAIDKLRALKDSRFALFVSYQSPHYPVQPLKRFADLYKNAKISRRPNAVDIDPYTATLSPPTPNPELDMNYMRYSEDLDEYIRLYYAMITQLDHNIGRIMDELKGLGLLENTVVMFTADHGDMQGSHGLKNKSLFYEESTRVPFIVRVPDGQSGVAKEELISTVDLYPSILDYCSVAAPEGLEGSSFVPLTYGDNQSRENEVFSEAARWSMCRHGDNKLVVSNSTKEPTHFFDLRNDPYEMTNLVSQNIGDKESMLQTLLGWRDRIAQQ